MLQYNPVHDPELVPFGRKLPGIDRPRDQLYVFASYLLAHGAATHFGFGLHPYTRVTDLCFNTIRVDLGEARGEYRPWQSDSGSATPAGRNLLLGGPLDSLDHSRVAEGLTTDSAEKHEGAASARLDSEDPKVIRIHSHNLLLKPHTTLTLTALFKTRSVLGGIGAQVIPYHFTAASTSPVAMLTASGTTDWTRHEMSFPTSDDETGRISFRLSEALGSA